MRIAFLVDQFPALSETFILHQITGLIDRGHQVDIYSNNLGNLSKIHPEVETYQLLDRTFYSQMPEDRWSRLLQGLGLVFSKGVKEPATCLASINPFQYGKQAASMRLLYSASRFMDKPPYDIIHCQLGFLGIQGLLLSKIGAAKGKLVTSIRGSDFMLYVNMFGKDYFNELFKEGDLFLPVCESFKQEMIKLGCDPNKIVVHRSGLDFESFAFTPRQERQDARVRLVTVARLTESKGVEYGIRAVAKLVPDYPQIDYQIIGDGPLMADLQQLIDELGVNGNAKLLGWKQRPEVVEILQQADIMVTPSITATTGAREGIPNVLKEAMAMGLPVISTQHSGIPELIEDGVSGFLVPEHDVDALAQKLGYLIDHSELWSEMSRAGRAHLEEHYNLNQLNDRLVEIYEQLLKTSGSSPACVLERGNP